jgi:K+ transporter
MSDGWLGPLWLSLLVAASVVFSLGLACAVPLAAFGAAAALTLSRRDALGLMAAVWLANEIVGYAVLGYPWTANSFAWGAVLGGVAVLTTEAARHATRRTTRLGLIAAAGLSFLAAFAVYEGALFVVSVAGLGGTEAYAPAVVGRVFALNAVVMAGLLLLQRLGAVAGLVAAPPRLAAAQRDA